MHPSYSIRGCLPQHRSECAKLTRVNKWDERYARDRSEKPAERIVKEAAAMLPPGTALDIASGPGRNSVYLAQGGWQVTAIDFSAVAIEQLQAMNPGIKAVVADLEVRQVEFGEGQYDLVIDTYYLWRPLFASIQRSVKPNGCFAAALPAVDDDPTVTPMNPAYLISPDELAASFAGWEFLVWRREKQAGKRLVCELLARKPNANE